MEKLHNVVKGWYPIVSSCLLFQTPPWWRTRFVCPVMTWWPVKGVILSITDTSQLSVEVNRFLAFSVGLPDLKKVVVIPYARSKQETDLSKISNRLDAADKAKETERLRQIYIKMGYWNRSHYLAWIFSLSFFFFIKSLQCIYRWLFGVRMWWVGPVSSDGVWAASIQPSSLHHVLVWYHGGS